MRRDEEEGPHVVTIEVEPADDGWVVKGPGNELSRVFHRQLDARAEARRVAQAGGGGEVVIHALSGRVAERNTVPSRASGRITRSRAGRRLSSGSRTGA